MKKERKRERERNNKKFTVSRQIARNLRTQCEMTNRRKEKKGTDRETKTWERKWKAWKQFFVQKLGMNYYMD